MQKIFVWGLFKMAAYKTEGWKLERWPGLESLLAENCKPYEVQTINGKILARKKKKKKKVQMALTWACRKEPELTPSPKKIQGMLWKCTYSLTPVKKQFRAQ